MSAEFSPSISVSWEARRAWPDEMVRLRRHLPLALTQAHPKIHEWVLTTGPAERLVGRIMLEDQPAETNRSFRAARAALAIRPSWGTSEGAAELLRLVKADAVEKGFGGLVIEVDFPSPEFALISGAGFSPVSRHEIWKVPLSDAISARQAAVDRMRARHPLPVHALDSSNLPAVRTLCARLGLLTPERVLLSDGKSPGFSARYSFLAGDPQKPAGVILCRILQGELYLEVLARDPDSHAQGTVMALLRASLIPAQDDGIADMLCTMTVGGAAHPAAALMRRGKGQRVRQKIVLAWQGKVPGAT